MRENSRRQQLCGRLKPQPVKKHLESKCLYLKLSHVTVFDSPLGEMPCVLFTQLQTIRITLWFCTVTPSGCRVWGISNEGKKPFGAERAPDIFFAFNIHQWQTTSSTHILLQHTPLRAHFHKIFFVRIWKWANYLNTKTPQRTVHPKADRNDLI